jgi:hypothetical protein
MIAFVHIYIQYLENNILLHIFILYSNYNNKIY